MQLAQVRRGLMLIVLSAIAASCTGRSDKDHGPSPFRDVGAVTEVVIHNWDSAFTEDTIRDRLRVDSIAAILQGGANWTSEPPRMLMDSMFAVGLVRDGEWQGGALIGPTFIADASRTLESDVNRYRVLSSAEATTFHRLLGRE